MASQAPAPGETSLSRLLQTLSPRLHPDRFIFLRFPPDPPEDLLESRSIANAVPPMLLPHAHMLFREAEGLTVILNLTSFALASGLSREIIAEHAVENILLTQVAGKVERAFTSRMVTLAVHSSLEAVGLMARVSSAVAEAGLSANPVSAFMHDHLFVADGAEPVVMRVLERLAREAQEEVRALE